MKRCDVEERDEEDLPSSKRTVKRTGPCTCHCFLVTLFVSKFDLIGMTGV